MEKLVTKQRLTTTLIAILSITTFLSALPVHASGTNFNNIVIIAMENQNYSSVIGSSSAPFINSLAALGTTVSNYHSYGQGINTSPSGCSAGCYEAFTTGQTTHSDSWCPRASSPCANIPNIANQLSTAGLTSAMFCEDGCPRGADHFPWIGYTNTWNTCVTGSFTCTGQTGPTGNLLYGSSSSNGNSAFINYLNGTNPANYIWFTPTDSHNMHDNSVATGDAYLQTLLIGTGTLSNPSANSVLGTNLLKAGHTFLYLWWDEYDPSPNVEYGTMIKVGHTSTGGYDEYDSLHSIEANWNLPFITTVVSGDTGMTDIFGTSGPQPLSASFTYTPTTVIVNQQVSFTSTVTGGTTPYTYSWTFGDTGTSVLANPTHTYTMTGTFTANLTVTDSASHRATTAQNIVVNTVPPPPPPVPGIAGWGGIALNEVAKTASGNPASLAFPGTTATDMEYALQIMQAKGMDGVRVDFDPLCTTSPSPIGANYDANNVQKAIQIAQFYNFQMVLDYHGYAEPFIPSTSTCWMNFWGNVTNQFKNSYPTGLIWELENEPAYCVGQGHTGPSCVNNTSTTVYCAEKVACTTLLSSQYQLLINRIRALGDNHWIVVQNVCSFGCSFCPSGDGDCSTAVQGYPTVTDSLGKIFISLHSYASNPTSYTIATADADATAYYNTVLSGVTSTGWKALNTEGGADAISNLVNPPPANLTGSAGYNWWTLRFIQTLTHLYDNATQRIGYLWWTAGDWTDTPGAGALGTLQCNSSPQGWGCVLQNRPTGDVNLTKSLVNAETASGSGGSTFTANVNGLLTSYTAGVLNGTLFVSITNNTSNAIVYMNIYHLNMSQVNKGKAQYDFLLAANMTGFQFQLALNLKFNATSSTSGGSLTMSLFYVFSRNVDFVHAGIININDESIEGAAYNSTYGPPPSSNWSARCDIKPDGIVNISDEAIANGYWQLLVYYR